MVKDDEDADQPVVHEVAEEDQEGREGVMQCVFVEIAFRPNEGMRNESVEVLAEGYHVEDLHTNGVLGEIRSVQEGINALPVTAEPGWHHTCVADE